MLLIKMGLLRRHFSLTGLIACVFLLGVTIVAIFPGMLSHHDPVAIAPELILTPPSLVRLFGTDQYGRDILSRVAYGARTTLSFALIAILISISLSTIIGLVAAYYSGRFGSAVMRLMDLLMVFPGILLALIMISLLGPGLMPAMIAVAFGQTPGFTRIIRGATLAVKNNLYIEAANAIGAPGPWILWRHVLPNVRQTVLVLAPLGFSSAILIGSSLSFLGLGAQPPTPEWGSILGEARGYLRTQWWVASIPGGVLAATLLSINILGDHIRDLLDPRLRLE